MLVPPYCQIYPFRNVPRIEGLGLRHAWPKVFLKSILVDDEDSHIALEISNRSLKHNFFLFEQISQDLIFDIA